VREERKKERESHHTAKEKGEEERKRESKLPSERVSLSERGELRSKATVTG